MSLIQEFMPRWRLRQVDRIAVAAEPEPAFRAVRSLDLFKVPVARSLFALRTFPDRVAAWLRGRAAPPAASAGVGQITTPGTGFHLLGESHREVAVGSVGRFWRPSIGRAKALRSSSGTSKCEPGFQRARAFGPPSG